MGNLRYGGGIFFYVGILLKWGYLFECGPGYDCLKL